MALPARRYRAPRSSVQGSDFVKCQGGIEENNSIAEHIRRRRFVTLWWIIGGPAGGDPFCVTIARG